MSYLTIFHFDQILKMSLGCIDTPGYLMFRIGVLIWFYFACNIYVSGYCHA